MSNEPHEPNEAPAPDPGAPTAGAPDPGAPDPGAPGPAPAADPSAPLTPGSPGNPFPPFAGGFGPWPDNQYFPQEDAAGQQLLDEQRASAADRADPKRWPMIGTAALAAVLAVVAPLLTFWDYRLDGSSRTIRYSGWGAITSSRGDTVTKAGHSERYGAALLITALVLVVGIVLVLVARWRLGNLVIALGSGAMVALGLVGLTIAEAVGSVDQPGLSEHVGVGVWLLVVGAVLAAIALVLASRRVLTAGGRTALPRATHRQPGV